MGTELPEQLGNSGSENGGGIVDVNSGELTDYDNETSGRGIGNGEGNSGRSDNGTGKRGRGRPRKNSGTGEDQDPQARVFLVDTDKKTPTRRKGQKGVSETEVAMGIAGVCCGIATLRGNHWYKSTEECLAVARPATLYLETLPPKTVSKIGNAALPLSLAVGLIVLFTDTIREEMRLINESRSFRLRAKVQETRKPGTGEYTPSSSTSCDGEQSGGNPAANSSIIGGNTLD